MGVKLPFGMFVLVARRGMQAHGVWERSVEDLVVGLDPDAGTVMQEEVRTADTDEDGYGQQWKQEQDERVTKWRSACFGPR